MNLNSPKSSSATEAEKHESQAADAESGPNEGSEHVGRRREDRSGRRRRKASEKKEHAGRGRKRNRRKRRAEKQDAGGEDSRDRKSRKAAKRAARKQEKEAQASATAQISKTGEGERKKREKRSKKGKGREKSKQSHRAKNDTGRKVRKEPTEDDLPDEEVENGFGSDEVAEDESDRQRQPRQNALRSPVATAVLAHNDSAKVLLFQRLRDQFSIAGIQLASTNSDASLVVSLGEALSGKGTQAKRGVRLQFVEPDGGSPNCDPIEEEGDTIPVPMTNLLRRFPEGALIDLSGNPTALGSDVLASVARDAVLSFRGGTIVPPMPAEELAPDLVTAVTDAGDTARLLMGLNWRSGSLPASIGASVTQHVVESFLDGAIGYRESGETKTLPLPFDWAVSPASRSIAAAAHGLDFVSGVLTYWFQKANKSRSKRIAQIDTVVKQKNVTASALLDRAGDIILQVAAESVKLPPEAWQLNIAIRRARAMVLFLLCSRVAAQKKIKFNEKSCTPVFRALVSILERIRWAGYGKLGTSSAMLTTINIAGLALPLRSTPFGANLFGDSLETAKRHLAAGLSPDGVWRQAFADHDKVFQSLRTLLGDLRTAGVLSTELAEHLAQMARFTASFLRSDGYSPPIGGLAAKRYRSSLAGAQLVLRSKRKGTSLAGGDGLEDAILFSQAGYFTSRSPEKKGAISSHLVMSAGEQLAGGPSLTFSCGSSFILIGGGSTDRKAGEEVRRATQRDPAAHNALRVDNLAYPAIGESGRLQIERAWEEKSWAGARLVNRLFPPSNMTRTVIHLKPLHAVLVVDEMLAGDQPRKFEQFWHLGPELKPRQRQAHHFRLGMEEGNPGGVIVAFDSGCPAVPRIGGPEPVGWTAKDRGEVVRNLYFTRELTTSYGVTAAFFRYTASTARHDIFVEQTSGGWKAALVCDGRQIAFTSEDDRVKLAP